MSWVFTFLIAIVTAAAGLFGAGYVAHLTIGWHRVSSFEGASGYFLVLMALLGAVAGFVVGAVASRVVGAESLAENAAGLGAGLGVVLLLSGIAAGYSYLTADFPPRIAGRELDLEVELRLPEGVELSALQGSEPPAQMTLYCGQKWSGHGDFRFDEARRVEGLWVVPVRLPITSSLPDRRLVIGNGYERGAYIPIPLPGNPGQADTAWGGWHAVEYLGDLSKPTREQRYEARCRVQPRAEE